MHSVISEVDDHDGLKSLSLTAVGQSSAPQPTQARYPVWATVMILAGILISVVWSGFLVWVFFRMLVTL